MIGDVSSCRAAWVKGLEFTPTPQVATLTQHPTLSSRLGEEQGVSLRWGRMAPFTSTQHAGVVRVGEPWFPVHSRPDFVAHQVHHVAQMNVLKNTVRRCFLAASLLAVCYVLAPGALVMASSSSEEALRARVEQCYSALQQGDWRKVEKYLTKGSREIFRDQTKRPPLGYRIQSIKLEPDGRTASVVVLVPLVTAAMPKPMPIPKTTLWRLVSGAWYMDLLPSPDPSAQEWLFGTAAVTTPQGRSPSLVSQDLKFDSTWVSVGVIEDSKPRVARFTFTNVSTHAVTLSEFQLGCDCLRLKTEQKEYQPGQTATLEFEFDPSRFGVHTEESFNQGVMIKTEPGGAYVKLTIAALVAPAPKPPAKP